MCYEREKNYPVKCGGVAPLAPCFIGLAVMGARWQGKKGQLPPRWKS